MAQVTDSPPATSLWLEKPHEIVFIVQALLHYKKVWTFQSSLAKEGEKDK